MYDKTKFLNAIITGKCLFRSYEKKAEFTI
jgi:hypothetical protein